MTHHRPTLVTIVLLTALLAACTDAPPEATAAPPARTPDSGTHGSVDGAGQHDTEGGHGADDHAGHGADEDSAAPSDTAAHEVTIAATEFVYSPAEVRVPAGEPVLFRLRNDGTVVHDLDLGEAGLHLHTDPGEEQAAVVTIDEPGRYVAECTEPGHTASGMRLVVEVY